MTDGVLIGIDAGTSVIKSVAFTLAGQQLGVASLPNIYQSMSDGGAEQDMARTWADTAKTLSLLSEQIPNLAQRLIAISVTGQGDGMWLVGKQGEPIAPAWLWLDARSAQLAHTFVASPDHIDHFHRTGTAVNACQLSTQMAWMNIHRPEVLEKATAALHCKDWLYFKLTDHLATDPSEANFTFGNFRDRKYAAHILDQLGAGATKRLLPPIVDGTIEAHGLSMAAAQLTGLKAGTPVTLGYVDIVCSGLGGGLFDLSNKVGCTIIGSTGVHMRLQPDAKNVKLNAFQSGYTMAFPAPNMVAQIQSNMASTLNIDWLTDMAITVLAEHGVSRSRADILRGLDDQILAKPAAQNMYHPYISNAGERGPFMDSSARAMLQFNLRDRDFVDLLRAVFEGICFAARDCYFMMGDMPQEIRVTGGAARSKAVRTILAGVLNSNVRTVLREESGAAGTAMIAAVQQKIYPSMQECVTHWVDTQLGPITSPDESLVKTYNTAFPHYKRTREALAPVWRIMSS
jgi:erythritol kinase (D-erythritol 1-phosphate-forming)